MVFWNGVFRALKICHLFELYFQSFPFWESGSEVREAVAVAAHKWVELERMEVAGDVAFGFGERAEEPAEPDPVGPDGDVDLIAREKGNGGTDAVDGRAIGERAFEIEAEALLGASSYSDDDVLGVESVEALE